jgi:hypothetical protein
MKDRMIRTGDLVVPDILDFLRDLDVYPWWGSKERGMPLPVGNWKVGEVGVVLESLEYQGGNGCEVLLGDGRRVWVNLNLVRKVEK